MSGVPNSKSALCCYGTVFRGRRNIHSTRCAYMHGDTRMHEDPTAAMSPCLLEGNLHARSVVLLVSARPAINTSKLIYLNTPSGIPQESGQSRTHIDRSRCAHSSTCRASRAQTFQSSLKSCVDLFHDITAFSFRPLLAPPMSLQPTSTDFRSSKPTMFGRPCHSVPRAKQSLRPCAAV
jgi:hypothetical protein